MKFFVLLFKEHLHDLEDNRQFAVFCVARIGSQIYDTSLVNPVDRHSTDVTFSDVLLFSKVSSNHAKKYYRFFVQNVVFKTQELPATWKTAGLCLIF